MELLAIDHVQLAMPAGAEADARRFYADFLGLTEVPKPLALAPRGGCWFERAGLRVHLGVETPFAPARKAHPAFTVSDLDALIARCGDWGIAFQVDETIQGVRRGFIADPFGNRIELIAA